MALTRRSRDKDDCFTMFSGIFSVTNHRREAYDDVRQRVKKKKKTLLLLFTPFFFFFLYFKK